MLFATISELESFCARKVTKNSLYSFPVSDNNYHACTKHIDLRFHFIQQTVASGTLKLLYRPTQDMIADVLTKALPKWKVVALVNTLGLRQQSYLV